MSSKFGDGSCMDWLWLLQAGALVMGYCGYTCQITVRYISLEHKLFGGGIDSSQTGVSRTAVPWSTRRSMSVPKQKAVYLKGGNPCNDEITECCNNGVWAKKAALDPGHDPSSSSKKSRTGSCKSMYGLAETTQYGCDYSEDTAPSGSSCPVVGPWYSPAKSQDTARMAHSNTHRNSSSWTTVAV